MMSASEQNSLDHTSGPQLSIVIPTYNRANYLMACLRSLPDLPDCEIVISDNASSDDTRAVITDAAGPDPRIRYFRNAENIGAYPNYNIAVGQARGRYICILSDDDLALPGNFEQKLAVLNAYPHIGLVYSLWYRIDSQGRSEGVVRWPGLVDFSYVGGRNEFLDLIPANYIVLTSVVFRRALWDQLGGFDLEHDLGAVADWDLLLRYARQSEVAFLNQPLVAVRYHAGSGTEALLAEGRFAKGRLALWRKWLLDNETAPVLDDRFWQHMLDAFVPDLKYEFGDNRAAVESRVRELVALKDASSARRKERTERMLSAAALGFLASPGITGTPKAARQADRGGGGDVAAPRDVAVSIIIPVYNRLQLTRACLASIARNTAGCTYEVIVVDNGSSDGSADFLRAEREQGRLRAILNDRNLGFAAACNQGARSARGAYLLFLNNDTEVQPGWLAALASVADGDATVAAVGARLLFPDGTVQHAGVVLADNRQCGDPLYAAHIHYRCAAGAPQVNQPYEYQALTAACLLVRGSCFATVGGFDEGYWNGYEDVDLCLRLREHGWRLVYQPESCVTHHESASGPERFRQVQANIQRLHARWLGKVRLDGVIAPDGVFQPAAQPGFVAYAASGAAPGAALSGGALQARTTDVAPYPLVSIIILTYNGLACTQACLNSIAACTQVPYELIIVDNGSTDGTVEFLRACMADHANVHLILNAANRGFAAGNNQGMALAQGDYVLLLNNDTIVTEGWLGRLLSVFERYPGAGIVGPMSNYVSGPQLVPHAAYRNVEELGPFAARWAQQHAGESEECCRIVGFCFLMRRAVMQRVGGLDERFGSGNFEDDDYCIRAGLMGYGARIARDVFIHHEGSQTFKDAHIDFRRSMLRNWDLFKAKWGIPGRTPIDRGYSITIEGLPPDAYLPLPRLAETHVQQNDGRLWQERSATAAVPVEVAPSGVPTVLVTGARPADGFWPSLIETAGRPLEILVVDAAAMPAGKQLARLPRQWHVSKTNGSAAALLNETLERDGDATVVLVSTDVVFTPGWLDALLAALAHKRDLAIAAPVSNCAPRPQKISTNYEGLGLALQRFAERRKQQHAGQVRRVPYVGSFCLALNAQAWQAIGPWRTDVSLADALWDYMSKAKGAGFQLAAVLDSYVHHLKLVGEEGLDFDERAAAAAAFDGQMSQGAAAVAAGDHAGAVQAYRKATERRPDRLEPRVALASALLDQGEIAAAGAVLGQAAALAPTDAGLHLQWAAALHQAGDLAAAETAYLETAELDHQNLQVQLNLFDIYWRQEKYTEAAAAATAALRLDRNNPDALATFATMCLALGDNEGAQLALARLRQQAPEHPCVAELALTLEPAAMG